MTGTMTSQNTDLSSLATLYSTHHEEFWDIRPYSPVSYACCLSHVIFYLAHSSILKMEEKYSSETSVNCQRTTRLISGKISRHKHRCENLKS
jgi:hypothetical protein